MAEPTPTMPPPHRQSLTLRDLCSALVESGEISQQDAEKVLTANLGAASQNGRTAPRHPLAGPVGRAGLLPHRPTKN